MTALIAAMALYRAGRRGARSSAESAQHGRSTRQCQDLALEPARARAALRCDGVACATVPCTSFHRHALRGVPWHAATTARGCVARTVRCSDSLTWLRSLDALPRRCHVVTSLPDIGELGLAPAEYERWFVGVVADLLRRLDSHAVAIFYQTDGRRSGEGGAWLDKSLLCHLGAREAGAACVWHVVVNGAPLGNLRTARPGYAHMLCFSLGYRQPVGASGVDVLPQRGHTSYAAAAGEAACASAVQFCRRVHSARQGASHGPSVSTDAFLPEAESEAPPLIVDPFCGEGTVLAAANAHGLDALGLDICRKRCAVAAVRARPRAEDVRALARRELEALSAGPGGLAYWGGQT